MVTSSVEQSGAPRDYETTIAVMASPEAVFDAITTVDGLTAWWVPRVTGSGETDGELRFFMNAPEPLVIRVDEATRPATVRWTVTDCPFLTDWVGTRPTFTITPVEGDATGLRFVHHGLTSELECNEVCTNSWNHFMRSLREYVETGRGMPMGSNEDDARRAIEAAS